MKINTKRILKTFTEKPMTMEDGSPLTVGIALSNVLLTDRMGGKMKCFVLAERLYKNSEVEVDEADFSLIKDAVNRTEAYNINVSGQLLVILDQIKSVDEKTDIEEKTKV